MEKEQAELETQKLGTPMGLPTGQHPASVWALSSAPLTPLVGAASRNCSSSLPTIAPHFPPSLCSSQDQSLKHFGFSEEIGC